MFRTPMLFTVAVAIVFLLSQPTHATEHQALEKIRSGISTAVRSDADITDVQWTLSSEVAQKSQLSLQTTNKDRLVQLREEKNNVGNIHRNEKIFSDYKREAIPIIRTTCDAGSTTSVLYEAYHYSVFEVRTRFGSMLYEIEHRENGLELFVQSSEEAGASAVSTETWNARLKVESPNLFYRLRERASDCTVELIVNRDRN